MRRLPGNKADDMTYEEAFARLGRSTFRRRFRLTAELQRYVAEKGIETVRRHAADFVRLRLAPANPQNDGRQTPMKGHPVFIAQHATGTCCRGCLEKWHHIPKGYPLSLVQQKYIVSILISWIDKEMNDSI